MKIFFFQFLLLFILFACKDQTRLEDHDILLDLCPAPQKTLQLEGQFILDKNTYIMADFSDSLSSHIADLCRSRLLKLTGHRLPIRDVYSTKIPETSIRLTLDESLGNHQAYWFDVSNSVIRITGGGKKGLVYGLSTLFEEFLLTKNTSQIQHIFNAHKIIDFPRFPLRGLIIEDLDMNALENTLDIMSSLKFNIIICSGSEQQKIRNFLESHPLYKEVVQSYTIHHSLSTPAGSILISPSTFSQKTSIPLQVITMASDRDLSKIRSKTSRLLLEIDTSVMINTKLRIKMENFFQHKQLKGIVLRLKQDQVNKDMLCEASNYFWKGSITH